jgi:hypothetical protein
MKLAAVAAAVMLVLGASGAGHAAGWSPPRMRDGTPDLQGVWSNASVTKLTRPPGEARAVVTASQAKVIAAPFVQFLDDDSAPTAASVGAPPLGGDPGGANAFWADPGRTLGEVKGQFRTSWIVDPADGQLPFSDTGRKLVAEAAAFARLAERPAGPEALQPWDRCLISSRGSGGPGMLNNIYNANYQIVQTAGFVAIRVEMIHDVRIVPLYASGKLARAAHGPAGVDPWLGDSVGWWEGDTLVIETTNVNREQGRAGPLYLTPQGRVTERFTRVAPGQIFYAFQVEDQTYYARPWRAEMTLSAAKGPLYEYACHEGNHAIANILAGARAEERAMGAGQHPSRGG